MKLSIVLSFLSAAPWAFGAAIPDQDQGVCNDNCFCNIRDWPNGKDDCKQFMATTVIPPESTRTHYVTTCEVSTVTATYTPTTTEEIDETITGTASYFPTTTIEIPESASDTVDVTPTTTVIISTVVTETITVTPTTYVTVQDIQDTTLDKTASTTVETKITIVVTTTAPTPTSTAYSIIGGTVVPPPAKVRRDALPKPEAEGIYARGVTLPNPVAATSTLRKRDDTVCSTQAPHYGSDCSDFAQYSSACSCLGETGYTVTLHPKVTKVESTVTEYTSTTTVTYTAAPQTVDSTTDAGTTTITQTEPLATLDVTSTVTTVTLTQTEPTVTILVTTTVSTASSSETLPPSTVDVTTFSTSTIPDVVTTDVITTTSKITSTSTTTPPAATVTVGVCNPDNNYGVIYSGGSTTDGPGQVGLDVSYPSYSSITTNAGCCAKCYSVPGCVLYYVTTECTLYVTDAGSAPSESAQCPNGIVGEMVESGSAYGISAACATILSS